MLGKLKPEETEQLLANNFIARIGCHADGTTYIVPISYAYDGKYAYMHSMEGMKLNIMRRNPRVCFEVDELKDMANWKSVIAWGDFEELHDPAERAEALKKLVNRMLPIVTSETMHLTPNWPFPDEDPTNIKGVVFRILLTDKSGRFESNASNAFVSW